MQGLLLSWMGYLSWEVLEAGVRMGKEALDFVSEKNTKKHRVYSTSDIQNRIIQKGLTCCPDAAETRLKGLFKLLLLSSKWNWNKGCWFFFFNKALGCGSKTR